MSGGFSSAGEPSGPAASPGVRASDADRDRVAEVLREAAVDGRLTAEEFGVRLEAALSSRTLGELAVLTADLAGEPGRSGVAAVRAGDVIRIGKRGGSVRRCGRWVVPRRLELRSSGCEVMLDFTDAVITPRHGAIRHGRAGRIPGPAGEAGHSGRCCFPGGAGHRGPARPRR